jgi:hypothetical protein
MSAIVKVMILVGFVLVIPRSTDNINLWKISSSLWEKCFAAMQEPFPALTRLSLQSER